MTQAKAMFFLHGTLPSCPAAKPSAPANYFEVVSVSSFRGCFFASITI